MTNTYHTAHLFTWKGTPDTGGPSLIGSVWVGADGRARWEPSLDGYFNPMPNDPRTTPRRPLDPADGADFVAALPYVFKAAPYTWAEVSDIPPRPDSDLEAATFSKDTCSAIDNAAAIARYPNGSCDGTG